MRGLGRRWQHLLRGEALQCKLQKIWGIGRRSVGSFARGCGSCRIVSQARIGAGTGQTSRRQEAGNGNVNRNVNRNVNGNVNGNRNRNRNKNRNKSKNKNMKREKNKI